MATMSANLPFVIDPISFCHRISIAALMVPACRAPAGVRPQFDQRCKLAGVSALTTRARNEYGSPLDPDIATDRLCSIPDPRPTTFPQGTNAREFTALVEFGGLTPAGALQAGTINAAMEMRWQNDIGSITKGKFADIVAISGDPMSNISGTEHVKFVMKGGEVFRNEFAPGAVGSTITR